MLGIIYSGIHPEHYAGLTNLIQLGTPALALGIFMMIKSMCKAGCNKVVYALGSTVFGIYLIEDIVRNQLEKFIVKYNLVAKWNDFFVVTLFVLATFVCSAIGVYVVQLVWHIKRVKK